MPNTEVFEQLSRFSECEGLSRDLCNLVSKNPEDSEVSELRGKLKAILTNEKNEDEIVANFSLADAAYAALILLADIHPINHEEFKFDDDKESEIYFVISEGYRFDIRDIVNSHNKRECREDESEKDGKWLLNSKTNEKMSIRDTKEVLRFFNRKYGSHSGADKEDGEVKRMELHLRDEQVGESPEQINKLRNAVLEEFGNYALTEELENCDLTRKHLIENEWFNTNEHRIGLRTLMKLCGWGADESLSFLKGLDREALFGFSKFNEFQILSLSSLFDKGLRVSHLNGKNWFKTIDHSIALTNLMTRDENPLDPENALQFLESLYFREAVALLGDLNASQADGIKKLSEEQLVMLRFSHGYGITAADLLSCQWPHREGGVDELKHLIDRNEKLFSPKEALKFLSKLNMRELIDIGKLTARQIRALKELSVLGLTVKDFIDNPALNTDTHCAALKSLMMRGESSLYVRKAVGILKDLNESQVWRIEELNDLQINILIKFCGSDLTSADLLDNPWLNKGKPRALFESLMSSEKNSFGAKKTLEFLGNLKDEELLKVENLSTIEYRVALMKLMMRERNTLTLEKALDVLKDLDESQMLRIEELTERHIEILEGFPNLFKSLMERKEVKSEEVKGEEVKSEENSLGAKKMLGFFSGLQYSELLAVENLPTNTHRIALMNLIMREEDSLTLEKAWDVLNVLNVLTESQVSGIERLNDVQIKMLKNFHDSVLTAEHFRDKPWFNSDAHGAALIYLMGSSDSDEITTLLTTDIVDRANEKYRMEVMNAACAKYLKSHEKTSYFNMNCIYHGQSGKKRAENIINTYSEHHDGNGEKRDQAMINTDKHCRMFYSISEAYCKSGTREYSLKRFIYDALRDSKTVGKKDLPPELLKEIKELDISTELKKLTL